MVGLLGYPIWRGVVARRAAVEPYQSNDETPKVHARMEMTASGMADDNIIVLFLNLFL